MSRKNRIPEEKARRAKIRELLQMANIDSMDDIQNLFKETIAEFMENGLEAELDEDLGYSKYDYKNKTTDNSRNVRRAKICGPVSAMSRFLFPVTGKVNLNHSF